MVTIWCAVLIEESGSILVSFLSKNIFFLLFFFSAANLTLKGAIFTEQRNWWYSHGKWHSDDEILPEKQTLLEVKEKKKSKTKHNTSPTPTKNCF